MSICDQWQPGILGEACTFGSRLSSGWAWTGWGSLGLAQKPVISLSPPTTPQEKLKYFPIRVNTKLEPEAEAEEGLGGLPSNITSVSSLLLFNTTENLYVQSGGRIGGPGVLAWLYRSRVGLRVVVLRGLWVPCTNLSPLLKMDKWVRTLEQMDGKVSPPHAIIVGIRSMSSWTRWPVLSQRPM